MPQIKVYGADWCSLTKGTRAHLDELGVAYDYIDVEQDATAAQWVRDQNDGKERKPTLDIAGQVLSEPSNEELDRTLRAQGLFPKS